jgi:uncharacterized damage-inducible protein DinB
MREEPWLRGPIESIHPLLAPVLYSFQQAREDLEKWTADLSDAQMWQTAPGIPAVAFQLRHIAGSVDRLMTYLSDSQLDNSQLEALQSENTPGATRNELLQAVETAFSRAETIVRQIDPATLTQAREVGRKKLPTTVAGLLIHIAEHTQRHVGQAIITAKLVKLRVQDA